MTAALLIAGALLTASQPQTAATTYVYCEGHGFPVTCITELSACNTTAIPDGICKTTQYGCFCHAKPRPAEPHPIGDQASAESLEGAPPADQDWEDDMIAEVCITE